MSQNNFDKLKELASRDHLTAISIVPDYKGFPLFINREEASWHDFDALKTAGIAAKDIQTSNFTVQPRYQYNNNGKPPLLDGYDVSNTVTVTVRKLDSLGNVLDKAVSAGSNQINGIQFQVSKPETAEDEARKLAVEDAHRKAMIYAKAGNVALGDIASISEGGGFEPPVPMLRAKAMSADGSSSAPPIAGGEQALGIDVNIVWVIK